MDTIFTLQISLKTPNVPFSGLSVIVTSIYINNEIYTILYRLPTERVYFFFFNRLNTSYM